MRGFAYGLLIAFLVIVSSVYVLAIPPTPPDITIDPPTYCVESNGGVEICDDIDNDCDELIDENDVCEEEEESSSGGGGGGGSSRTSTVTTITTTTNTTEGVVVTQSSTDKGSIGAAISSIFDNSGGKIADTGADESLNDVVSGESSSTLLGLPMKKAVTGIIILGVLLIILFYVVIRLKRKAERKNKGIKIKENLPEIKKLDSKNAHQAQSSAKTISKPAQTKELSSREMPAMKYVEAMRQRGFKDDYIHAQLKSKGWNEETLSKIFNK